MVDPQVRDAVLRGAAIYCKEERYNPRAPVLLVNDLVGLVGEANGNGAIPPEAATELARRLAKTMGALGDVLMHTPACAEPCTIGTHDDGPNSCPIHRARTLHHEPAR